MSIEQMTIILHHSEAVGTEKVLLLGIANHDGDGGAWPSHATLCKYANVGDRPMRRALQRLVEIGELKIHVQRGGTADTPDAMRTNRYELLVECPEECDRTAQHRVRGAVDAQGGRALTPRGGRAETPTETSLETSINPTPPSSSFSTGREATLVTGNVRLPRGWYPGDPAMTEMKFRFGPWLDVDLELTEFNSYYAEHPEKKSTDWIARFAGWCSRHAKQVREQREQAAAHDDDFGNPRNQRKVSRVDTMTDEDLARERAAVLKRHGVEGQG